MSDAGSGTTAVLTLSGRNGLADEVAVLSGQNLYACYQCGKCTAGCPFSFGPQQVVRYLQLGQVPEALALDTVWDCAGCFTCAAACPKSVDPSASCRALRSLPPERLPGSNHRRRGPRQSPPRPG